MKTELEKKAKEPTTSVDAKEKELAERAAECEKLKEQLKQEKEQSIDLARKVRRLSIGKLLGSMDLARVLL